MNNHACKLLVVAALACLAFGCGSKGPRLYKAGGTVTYKDKPLENAMVNFFYEDGSSAAGLSDASGKFELNYLGRTGGAAAGKCSVTVVMTSPATSVSAAPPGKLDISKMSPEEQKKMMTMTSPQSAIPAAAGTPAVVLPAKYSDPKTSGLQFEIQANNNNNIPIVLKD